jgi:acetolactate decarboxylase
MMHKGDLSAQIDLSEFAKIENFYALGAFENLKGEIQIFDSTPNNSFVENGEISIDKEFSKSATLLVYAVVDKWISIQIPKDIRSQKEVEKYIEEIAEENNIDTDQPFPFLIEGKASEISWHVINWKDGDTEHSHEKHVASGLNGMVVDEEVELLGFYSNSHHRVFTHHTSNTHIHLRLKDGIIAGHADEIKLGENMVLKIPDNHGNLDLH